MSINCPCEAGLCTVIVLYTLSRLHLDLEIVASGSYGLDKIANAPRVQNMCLTLRFWIAPCSHALPAPRRRAL